MTIRRLVPTEARGVVGAFQDAKLAGVAGLSFESREKIRHKATLFGMYVPPRFRGLGLGPANSSLRRWNLHARARASRSFS